MKATQVALRPTPASDASGRPALTPELLAASGARYSRNNEGLEAMIERGFLQDVTKEKNIVGFVVDGDDERLRRGGHGSVIVVATWEYKEPRIGKSLVVN